MGPVFDRLKPSSQRIAALASDLVAHRENRSAGMGKFIEAPGKAMIVGGTRKICAKLYTAIVELRPELHSDDLAIVKIKVVYSGTPSDVPPVSDHVRRDSASATVKERLKDADDELELVIVEDMMLAGYDSPPLHTLYLDRPLKGGATDGDLGPREPHVPRQGGRAAGESPR